MPPLTPRRPPRDLSTGRPLRHILRLSIPATAEQILFSATDLVSLFFLGLAGGTAQAAVAMAVTLRMVLISPMMGLSVGGMAVAARHVGAREGPEADKAAAQTILLIACFTIPLSLLGLSAGEVFLGWMGAGGALRAEALAYLRIICAGLFFMECLPTLNGVIRAAGHPEWTLAINACRTAALLALGPVLIPRLGVRGAGLADVASSAAGVAAQLAVLLGGRAGLRLRFGDLRPERRMMGRILRVAVPTSAQRFAPNLANALLMGLVSSFGTQVLTAYSVTTRILGFLQGPANGIGVAASTMVGQNLGARDPRRAERAALLCLAAALCCGVPVFGAVGLWPVPVLRLFTHDPPVLAAAVETVRGMLPAALATSWSTVMISALGGAGDTLAAMWIGFGSLTLQLGAGWALSRGAGLGSFGIWIGLGAGLLSGALLLTGRFLRGRWKHSRV